MNKFEQSYYLLRGEVTTSSFGEKKRENYQEIAILRMMVFRNMSMEVATPEVKNVTYTGIYRTKVNHVDIHYHDKIVNDKESYVVTDVNRIGDKVSAITLIKG